MVMAAVMIMVGRSPKILHTFVMILLHLKLAFNLVAGDSTHLGCIERERQALLVLKQDLVDEYGWLSSWGSEDQKKNCCEWRGVQCSNRNGHIVKLDLFVRDIGFGLEFHPLRGKINPSLIELHHLKYLDLSYNNFIGSQIPPFIGSLSNLKYLNLTWAKFSGPIPSQLGNLSHLEYLNLEGNHLKNVENLEFLSHLSSLKYLDMCDVNLSKAHDWVEVVSHLSMLSTLHLCSCDLLPVTLSILSHVNYSHSLTTIDLFDNHLTSSIFPWLFNYSSSLVELDLPSNNLQGSIPNAFGSMSSLEILSLFDNHLEGSIPKSIGNKCNLRELDLWFNNISGQLVELTHNLSGCGKHSLEYLNLAQNQITGSLPDFTIFTSLKELRVHGNKLNGTLPKSIGNLYQLEVLELSWNSLGGVVSEAYLSNLFNLRELALSYNSLTLEFNTSWVPPFQLYDIRLASCKLGPNFPNWIRTQLKISYLDISSAEISDTIPKWFWDQRPLYFSNLSNNQISGRLPNLSKKFLGFPGMDLSSNCLEGPLPLFPPNTSNLNLSRNRFSGLVSSLCKIVGGHLDYLDLSDNLFSGELPNCFSQWPKVVVLNLANNNLSGKIPLSLGLLPLLQTLDLRNNSFSGDLPSSLQNCGALKFIDLGDNKISGKLPAWIGERLSVLHVLILSSNKFYGSIPLHLCHLSYLRILDLSLNDISGTIPLCLNNFSSMARKVDSKEITVGFSYYTSDTVVGVRAEYVDSAMVVLKGREYEYGKNLGLLRIINLSSNKLIGKLPREIFSLLELTALNISRNNLTQVIPETIGQLKQLQSLDLSRNHFSGEIPSSISDLNFLSHLDLSYNNLSGKIPSGTQIQSFNDSMFVGNDALCGPPLTKKCPGEETPNSRKPTNGGSGYNQEGDEFKKWFYAGMGLGFGAAFWGVCGTLLLKRSWRHAYFIFLDNLKDWLYVTVAVNKARLKMKFQSSG